MTRAIEFAIWIHENCHAGRGYYLFEGIKYYIYSPEDMEDLYYEFESDNNYL